MIANFAACLAFILQAEGGFVDDPRDNGHATNKGITIGTFRHIHPGATVDQLRHISDADVAAIYHTGYWNAVRGDELPAGVDLMVFDIAVNAGPGRAIRILQASAFVMADGMLGPVTLAALHCFVSMVPLIDAMDDRMRAYYQSLDDFDTFGDGWLNRCDARLDAANKMAALSAVKGAK